MQHIKRNIVETSDGSKTIELQGVNEHYHSIHGALQESLHVFIHNGLQFQLDNGSRALSILEIGFGTGLNLLTTMNHLKKQPVTIEYMGIEAFPLAKEIINELCYNAHFEEELISYCKAVLNHPNEVRVCSESKIKATQVTESLVQVKLPSGHFDLIYFDAFGPRVQPEMWTLEVFMKMQESLSVGGCLVTYCAKGAVKRSMKAAGFEVESLPGPPGKREMTRAIKR